MGFLARFRKAPDPPPVDPAGALHLHFVATDHAIIIGSVLLLALAHFIIGRARRPPPRLVKRLSRAFQSLSRRFSLAATAETEGRRMSSLEADEPDEPRARRESVKPWDPHPKCENGVLSSVAAAACRGGWTSSARASHRRRGGGERDTTLTRLVARRWTRPDEYHWQFFAVLLVGLVAVIFEGSFRTVRLFYTCTSLSLMAYRLGYYYKRGLLLYVIDLCYWVHFVGLWALWYADLPSDWALAALASAVGPVGGAVFMLQSPLLLHHPEAFMAFFLHVVPCWVAYVVRWRVMPPLAPELLPLTVWMPFRKVYLPWAAVHLTILLVKPYSPLSKYEMLFDWYTGSVAGVDGTGGRGQAQKRHAPPFASYAWKPVAYIAAHALFSVEGYCAAALSLRYEAVMLVWVSLIFISNINSAFNFYRASVDESYSPGNKLISGLRDSAVSWAIILPLYYYCENGAAAA